MLSPDSGVGSNEAFYTPSQSRQRPLVRGSSSKRSLFREEQSRTVDSDDDNGMAGMSPLAYSDENSSAPISPEIQAEKSVFSSLRKITQDARNSPRKILFPLQPQNTPPRPMDTTEIVPETPQSCDGTPLKSDSPVLSLVTPLRSLEKDPLSLPKLSHRRKILNDEPNDVSPVVQVRNAKRCLSDSEKDDISSAKMPKVEETNPTPKARTSLFQEKPFELDTKSFYGSSKASTSSSASTSRQSFGGNVPTYRIQKKLRRSTFNAKSARKSTGGINFGVKHGIKPKIKKPPVKEAKLKQVKQEAISSAVNDKSLVNKTNKFVSSKIMPDAKITINDRIKLDVYDKKIVLPKKECKVPKKKPALHISFDAADLSVEEPAIEQQKNGLEKLLQSLRDDWDEVEEEEPTGSSMSIVSNATLEVSSAKETSTDVSNSLMSPESELSNMTQDMNIEDGCGSQNKDEDKKKEDGEQKVYSIFRKNFSANHVFNETKKKKGVKRSWQSSILSNQYQLDAGQKNFGATQCKECGTIYNAGDGDDENAHLNYHNSYRTLSFSGWKNERVIYEEFGDRIILVEPGDSKSHWNKVNEVLKIVDMDLGLAEVNLCEYQDKRIYLYVRDKTILGVVVAEHKDSAYRMIPDLLEFDCCTKESTPVKCGINVVWTAMKYRKSGIATKLVNALRANFYYGYIMNLDDIAFSMPTPSGKIFAEKYTKSRDFKVYY